MSKSRRHLTPHQLGQLKLILQLYEGDAEKIRAEIAEQAGIDIDQLKPAAESSGRKSFKIEYRAQSLGGK